MGEARGGADGHLGSSLVSARGSFCASNSVNLQRRGEHVRQRARALGRAVHGSSRDAQHGSGHALNHNYRGGLCSGIDQRPHVTTSVDVSWGDTECGADGVCARAGGRAGGRGVAARRTDRSVDSSGCSVRDGACAGSGDGSCETHEKSPTPVVWRGETKASLAMHYYRQHSATDDYGVQDREGPTHCPAVAQGRRLDVQAI